MTDQAFERVKLTKEQAMMELAWATDLPLSVLEEAMYDCATECFDGCRVEPDGGCSHGYRSPLLVLGLI